MTIAELPMRPALKRQFRFECVAPSDMFLLSEQQELVFSAQEYFALAPLLDGNHTVAELVDALHHRRSVPHILHALRWLNLAGVLTDGPTALPVEQAAFWEAQGVDANTAAQALGQARLTLRSIGGLPTYPLQEALACLGLPLCANTNAPSDLDLVITERYICPALANLNIVALASGRPWMPVQLSGSHIWVGPLFHPGVTGCWACLAAQLCQCEPTPITAPPDTPWGQLPTAARFGAAWAATEIAKQIAHGLPTDSPALLVCDPSALMNYRHPLVQQPNCPACRA